MTMSFMRRAACGRMMSYHHRVLCARTTSASYYLSGTMKNERDCAGPTSTYVTRRARSREPAIITSCTRKARTAPKRNVYIYSRGFNRAHALRAERTGHRRRLSRRDFHAEKNTKYRVVLADIPRGWVGFSRRRAESGYRRKCLY